MNFEKTIIKYTQKRNKVLNKHYNKIENTVNLLSLLLDDIYSIPRSAWAGSIEEEVKISYDSLGKEINKEKEKLMKLFIDFGSEIKKICDIDLLDQIAKAKAEALNANSKKKKTKKVKKEA